MSKEIPKIGKLVERTHQMATLDTYDFTRGHLSKLPAICGGFWFFSIIIIENKINLILINLILNLAYLIRPN